VQRNASAEDRAAFVRALGRDAPELASRDDDLEDLLALMALVDEYVGVGNTNMHLRAAAGATARLLAPLATDWRWGTSGDESRWFPGFRIYREAAATGWTAALERLSRDIAAVRAAERRPTAAHD
jgi:hypothetical protein